MRLTPYEKAIVREEARALAKKYPRDLALAILLMARKVTA